MHVRIEFESGVGPIYSPLFVFLAQEKIDIPAIPTSSQIRVGTKLNISK